MRAASRARSLGAAAGATRPAAAGAEGGRTAGARAAVGGANQSGSGVGSQYDGMTGKTPAGVGPTITGNGSHGPHPPTIGTQPNPPPEDGLIVTGFGLGW